MDSRAGTTILLLGWLAACGEPPPPVPVPAANAPPPTPAATPELPGNSSAADSPRTPALSPPAATDVVARYRGGVVTFGELERELSGAPLGFQLADNQREMIRWLVAVRLLEQRPGHEAGSSGGDDPLRAEFGGLPVSGAEPSELADQRRLRSFFDAAARQLLDSSDLQLEPAPLDANSTPQPDRAQRTPTTTGELFRFVQEGPGFQPCVLQLFPEEQLVRGRCGDLPAERALQPADLVFLERVVAGGRRGMFSRVSLASGAPPIDSPRLGSKPVELQEEVLALASGAVVFVRTALATGSGFVVATDGGDALLLTNAHVVAGGGRIVKVVWDSGLPGEREVGARVVATSPGVDLALLRTPLVPGARPLLLRADVARPGTSLVAVGFPFGRERWSPGRNPTSTAAVGRLVGIVPTDPAFVQVDAAVNPGNSGGPVLDEAGRVLGVATAHLRGTDVTYAITAEAVRSFLTSQGLELAAAVAPEPEASAVAPSAPIGGEAGVLPGHPSTCPRCEKVERELRRALVIVEGSILPRAGVALRTRPELLVLTTSLGLRGGSDLTLLLQDGSRVPVREVAREEGGFALLSAAGQRGVVATRPGRESALRVATPVIAASLSAAGELRLDWDRIARVERERDGTLRYAHLDVGNSRHDLDTSRGLFVFDDEGGLLGSASPGSSGSSNLAVVIPLATNPVRKTPFPSAILSRTARGGRCIVTAELELRDVLADTSRVGLIVVPGSAIAERSEPATAVAFGPVVREQRPKAGAPVRLVGPASPCVGGAPVAVQLFVERGDGLLVSRAHEVGDRAVPLAASWEEWRPTPSLVPPRAEERPLSEQNGCPPPRLELDPARVYLRGVLPSGGGVLVDLAEPTRTGGDGLPSRIAHAELILPGERILYEHAGGLRVASAAPGKRTTDACPAAGAVLAATRPCAGARAPILAAPTGALAFDCQGALLGADGKAIESEGLHVLRRGSKAMLAMSHDHRSALLTPGLPPVTVRGLRGELHSGASLVTRALGDGFLVAVIDVQPERRRLFEISPAGVLTARGTYPGVPAVRGLPEAALDAEGALWLLPRADDVDRRVVYRLVVGAAQAERLTINGRLHSTQLLTGAAGSRGAQLPGGVRRLAGSLRDDLDDEKCGSSRQTYAQERAYLLRDWKWISPATDEALRAGDLPPHASMLQVNRDGRILYLGLGVVRAFVPDGGEWEPVLQVCRPSVGDPDPVVATPCEPGEEVTAFRIRPDADELVASCVNRQQNEWTLRRGEERLPTQRNFGTPTRPVMGTVLFLVHAGYAGAVLLADERQNLLIWPPGKPPIPVMAGPRTREPAAVRAVPDGFVVATVQVGATVGLRGERWHIDFAGEARPEGRFATTADGRVFLGADGSPANLAELLDRSYDVLTDGDRSRLVVITGP